MNNQTCISKLSLAFILKWQIHVIHADSVPLKQTVHKPSKNLSFSIYSSSHDAVERFVPFVLKEYASFVHYVLGM